jgi:hypothetical protein
MLQNSVDSACRFTEVLTLTYPLEVQFDRTDWGAFVLGKKLPGAAQEHEMIANAGAGSEAVQLDLQLAEGAEADTDGLNCLIDSKLCMLERRRVVHTRGEDW